MNSKKIIAALSTIALSVGFALPAAAQSLTGTVNTATQAAVGVGDYSNTNASANVGVGVDVSGSASGNSTSSSAGTNTQATGSASAPDNTAVNLDVTPLIITRADVDSQAVTATSADASSVHSDSDLSGYVAAQLASDDNISQVQTAPENVAVTYKQHAKLFGFIPVDVDATANVDAAGNVTISYPWYAFFAATNKADLQAKLQDQVNAEMGANASANASASTQLTASGQAKIVAAVKAAMQAELNADTDASASTTASGY